MKKLAITLIAAATLAAQVRAQNAIQVTYSADLAQRTIHTSDGNPVADGNTVWIGAFDPTFIVNDFRDDPAALFSAWHQFDLVGPTPTTDGTIITTTFGQPGSFNDNASSLDPFFNNQRIYIWIFSTDGAAPPDTADDFSNVNEYGLFTAASWQFPSVGGPFPNRITINTDQVDNSPWGLVLPSQLHLMPVSPVPEPSTLGLLSLAIPALVLAFRRRSG